MKKHNRHMIFRELRERFKSMEDWAKANEWTIFQYENNRLDGMITALYFSGCVNDKVYHRLSAIRIERVKHCLHKYN